MNTWTQKGEEDPDIKGEENKAKGEEESYNSC